MKTVKPSKLGVNKSLGADSPAYPVHSNRISNPRYEEVSTIYDLTK